MNVHFQDWCHEHALYTAESSAAIRDFCREVNERAEQKMLITGKLEGSHKAAMDELLKEWGLK